MKKIRMAFLALTAFALLSTSTSCGGGGGSDDDDTPAAESSSTGGSGSESADPSGGDESTDPGSGSGSTTTSIPAGFVAVPGATFNETTAITGSYVFIAGRTVTIPSLWVCDHEVTQGEYEQYCSYGGSSPSTGYGKGSSYPAYYVSWYAALVYCNKRSLADGRTPCYKINGKTNPSEWGSVPTDSDSTWNAATCDFAANAYRLPTEAEWEYLARGGNLTNSGQTTYSGSDDDIESVAWYSENSGSQTHEVKEKAANALGLYDMSGNVWEWCWDRWTDIITTSTPSAGAASGSFRVSRGGSWNYFAYYCTVSSRSSYSPYGRYCSYGGFRVVCSRSE